MFSLHPIFADIGDLLSALVPVVIFVIWVIGQIANRAKEAPAKPVRRAEPRPAADWAGNDGLDDDDDVIVAQAGGGAKKSVFDEIEQFLARARQQAQQAQQAAGQQAAPAKPILIQPAAAAEPIAAEVVQPRGRLAGEVPLAPTRLGTRDRIAANVQRTVETSDITANIDRLGDAVEIADDVMEAHLKQVFDHRVGTLQQSGADTQATRRAAADAQKRATGQSVPVAPVDFAAMLANTGNLRQAIVLNEILNRPTGRW